MNDLDELFQQLPIGDIAAALGVSEADASAATGTALPSLVRGLQANATEPAGASSLWEALRSKDSALVTDGISLGDVDTADGAKILGHIFGAQDANVAARLGGLSGTGKVDSSLMSKLMQMLAPIVMAWIAKKVLGGTSSSGSSSASGGGLEDLLGGLLGGGR